MSTAPPALPATHRALMLRDPNQDPKVEVIPVPEVTAGAAVIRILTTGILSYMKDLIIGNKRNYNYRLPIVPGVAAVGRIAALGPDATSPKIGQLVFFDCLIKTRDSQSGPKQFLSAITAGHSEESRKLMVEGGFQDGSFAEYMRTPLENLFVLDEARLLGDPAQGNLGLTVDDLCALSQLPVPAGGLNSVGLKPGETVLISPSTGPFGGAACGVALAMGARVLAWGRNEEKLENVKRTLDSIDNGRFKGLLTVLKLHNGPEKDTQAIRAAAGGRSIDVFFEISPPEALSSTHLKTGILSLRHGGRVCLMGGQRGDVPIPHSFVMHNDNTIKGKWMHAREDIFQLIRMIETGILKIGKAGGSSTGGAFSLDDWKQALDLASEESGLGQRVVFNP
jgi:threonine dehydrogenase-like Zn-dependent dehydrogenase